MPAMETFYALLSSASESQNPYLQGLAKLTRVDLQQAGALRSSLGWQDWSATSPKPAAA
ncbi:MAG: hypothetical protein HYR70_00485 [Chloroflexi bacterium]|nr:hypothetical protein [Chloroflexota bacterium]MBI1856281.1 hypothetical protein [Chloroflexota bacterium]